MMMGPDFPEMRLGGKPCEQSSQVATSPPNLSLLSEPALVSRSKMRGHRESIGDGYIVGSFAASLCRWAAWLRYVAG